MSCTLVGVTVRKVGVEEELLLVDPATGRLAEVSQRALREHHDDVADAADESGSEGGDPQKRLHDIEHELFLQQIETASAPCVRLDELQDEVRRCRRSAGEAARAAGAAAVAVAAPVLVAGDIKVTPKDRYRRIVDSYGEVGRQADVCGMHVHVEVDNDDQRVGVLDRIRPWLPFLLAVSANSPFWRGTDTGYASWRSRVWGRWPTAGPAEPYGDLAGYETVVEAFLASGAALDRGMLYLDARLAAAYSTVEIRVADVCTDVDDALLVAALSRGLVETAASEWSDGVPPAGWRTDLLRAAHWRAAQFGISTELIDPVSRKLAPPRDVFASLVGYTADALDEAGDTELVTDLFERLLARGAGASRQRAVAEATGDLEAVVADLRNRTEASWLST
jgi:glutamate---cysteine ligase / carboxylate-amine ligase